MAGIKRTNDSEDPRPTKKFIMPAMMELKEELFSKVKDGLSAIILEWGLNDVDL